MYRQFFITGKVLRYKPVSITDMVTFLKIWIVSIRSNFGLSAAVSFMPSQNRSGDYYVVEYKKLTMVIIIIQLTLLKFPLTSKQFHNILVQTILLSLSNMNQISNYIIQDQNRVEVVSAQVDSYSIEDTNTQTLIVAAACGAQIVQVFFNSF